MSFPDYWFSQALQSMGWPKKEGGFLNKNWVVDSTVADMTLDLLIDTVMLIGVNRTEIGTKLLVNQWDDRDWNDKKQLEDFISLLDRTVSTDHDAENIPNLLSNTTAFTNTGPKFLWELLGHEKISYVITIKFISGLWFALTKPKLTEKRLNKVFSPISGEKDILPGLKADDLFNKFGLKGSTHSREEMLQTSLDTVAAYERDREKLKAAPIQLLNYIEKQRSSEKV